MAEPNDTLAPLMDDFMAEHGFKYLKSRNLYKRKTDYGFDEFMWLTEPICTNPWGHLGDFGLGLRHDDVDLLVQDVFPTYPPEARKKNPIMYRATGNHFPFDPVRDAELKLGFDTLATDCAAAAERMKRMLIEDGFAWYTHYSDVKNLSRDLNRDIPKRQPHDQATRATIANRMKLPVLGVAAACLAEPERVPQLMSDYLEYMGQWGGEAFVKRENENKVFEKQFEQVLSRAREYGCNV